MSIKEFAQANQDKLEEMFLVGRDVSQEYLENMRDWKDVTYNEFELFVCTKKMIMMYTDRLVIAPIAYNTTVISSWYEPDRDLMREEMILDQ